MVGQIIAIIVALFLVYAIYTYNKFVGLRNGIENTYKQISVAMKKRLDMISSLVESTKSYLKYEKEVLENVTRMRSMSFSSYKDLEEADKMAREVFGRILAIVENYPNIKGVEVVKEIQEGVKRIEEEIARLRYLYNDMVQSYNMLCERFPSNIIAGIFGFRKKKYLEMEGEVERRPSTKVY